MRADLQHSRWVGHKRASINKKKKKKQREYIMQYVIREITRDTSERSIIIEIFRRCS